MKRQFIKILAVVVCSCFFFVSQVSASSNIVIFDSLYVSAVVNNSDWEGTTTSSVIEVYESNITGNFSSVQYYFTCRWIGRTPSQTTTTARTLESFILPVNIPSNNELPGDLMVSAYYTYNKDMISSIKLNYSDGSSYTMAKNIDYSITKFDSHKFFLNGSNTSTNLYDLELVSFSFVPAKSVSTIEVITSGGSSYCWAYGFLVTKDGYLASYTPPSEGGISEEQRQANQEILDGIENIGVQLTQQNEGIAGKLEDIELQDSSYYSEMVTPNETYQSAVESMESVRQEGQAIVDEYNDLNNQLSKPDVNDLLPDYDRVVDGYVDYTIFDVFSTIYENGYIMFLLLVTTFFGVASFALFGKKA